MTTDVRRVMLSLNIDANVAAAKAGLGDVATEAKAVADAADDAGGKLLGIADKADATATNFATLAGAAGDIAGGLDSVGLGQFSDELESVAPPLMLIAGLADVTAVATNFLSAANIRARATTIAKAVAEKAGAAATKAMAVSQWALNAAMSANPIGLIVLAVVALIAGLVLAYKKSETFRDIVNTVGRVGRRAIQWLVDKVGDLVGWVKDKLPGAFGKFKDLAVRYIRLVTTPHRKLIDWTRQIVDWVRDKLPGAFGKFKDLAVRYIGLVTTPHRKLIDWTRQLVGCARPCLARSADSRMQLGALSTTSLHLCGACST
jgi:phage-related protein